MTDAALNSFSDRDILIQLLTKFENMERAKEKMKIVVPFTLALIFVLFVVGSSVAPDMELVA